MTTAEYNQQKSVMYKKYKAGEITNYAYIQWKKKNDPAKNGAGTAAPAGMTDKEKKDLLDYINDLAADGDIEYGDANELAAMVSDLQKNGIGHADAKDAIKDAVALMDANGMDAADATMMTQADVYAKAQAKAAKAQSSGFVMPTGSITKEQFAALGQQLLDEYQAGKYTKAEYAKLGKQLGQIYMNSGGAGAAAGKAAGAGAGSTAADDALKKLEKELKKIYGTAAQEMTGKLNEFIDKYGALLAEKQDLVAQGKMTKAQLDTWISNKGEIIKLMNAKISQMTDTMLAANQKAAGMINGETVGVFAENANYQSYDLSQAAGLNLSFAVYDEDTAKRLIMEKPELLPRKEVNGKKDKAWNQKKIAHAVLQGVIQGESIPTLAKRIATDTASTNMKAMVRYARTAMTGAQNSGRIETLKRAAGMGIKVRKRWLATLDSRTRDSHQQMDGVTVDITEKFVTPLGSKMDYPGDLAGKQGDIWNCRCTMIYVYDEFPDDLADTQRIQYDDYYTTYKDKDGKKHKVYHRTGDSLITDMNYDEWKAAKQGSKMNDLSIAKATLADAQKAVIKHKIKEDKVYKDLWKDDVTLADYPAKKAGIAAKRDYYTAEIDKLNAAIANGESWASPDKVKELEKKRKLLNEFERNGELIEKRNAALKAVQDIYDQTGLQKTAEAPAVAQPKTAKKAAKKAGTKAGGDSAGSAAGGATAGLSAGAGTVKTQFAPDAWGAKTKKAAARYDKRGVADRDLRKELDDEWDSLTEPEKYAAWEYTRNSNPMNKSLSGYHDSWGRSNFLGYANTRWGYEDAWRSIPSAFRRFGKNGKVSYHKAITDLTKAIEKTVFKKDRWLVRGSDNGGLAGMLEGAGMDFDSVKRVLDRGNINDIRKLLVGQKAMNHAFTSTGIASDAGFDGEVKFSIYAPKGTKAMYAEPQSYYGRTINDAEIYRKGKPYSSVGSEAEVILQRGTSFVIRGVKQTRTGIEVEMEIVEQPDYFQYGDEDTYNGGKTRHKN